MWKAFPKDYAMIKAFHQMSNRLNEKITAKVYKILKIEFVEIQRKIANDRVMNRYS